MLHHAGPHGKQEGQPGGRENKGIIWARAFIVVPRGRNGRGRVSRLSMFRITSVNNFSRLWGIGAAYYF